MGCDVRGGELSRFPSDYLGSHSTIQAARLGCFVDTVTLSSEQMVMTEERAKAAGVEDHVGVHLCDYRDLPPSFEHAFDALITCEMIEVSPESGSCNSSDCVLDHSPCHF